jgi:hypothetical protein
MQAAATNDARRLRQAIGRLQWESSGAIGCLVEFAQGMPDSARNRCDADYRLRLNFFANGAASVTLVTAAVDHPVQ